MNRRVAVFVLTIIVLSALFLTDPLAAFSKQSGKDLSIRLIEIETRPAVKVKFILIEPENPVASVILFAGGHGDLRLTSFFGKPSINWGSNIFLVRTREDFAKHGLVVALVDKPSDKPSGDKISARYGLNTWNNETKEQFRMSNEHAQDIKSVASYLKKDSNIPVWLVGTSWGTVSAANAAIRIKEGIDGLVLTSSMTRAGRNWHIYKSYPNIIINMDLDKISVPTLIVSHKEDKCNITPATDAPKIAEGIVNSSKVEIMYFTGGKRPIEEECYGLSAHGFYGIETEVVSAIADFIKSNSK